MFSFRRPSDVQIRDYLARQAEQPFSYDSVGCTRREPVPLPGWNIDRHRVCLGRGAAVFRIACDAIRQWRMFPPAVATVCGPDLEPLEGTVVGVLYWAAPVRVWMLFPARVVYELSGPAQDGDRQVEQFGFAYGTLLDHPERGEERFLVEWDRGDDSVWYDLLAVSRPAHWLARLGYPYTRYEQARFRRLSGQAMQQAAVEKVI